MKTITGIITFFVVVALLAGGGLALKYGCRTADVAIERKVFEGSYQRSESLKARIATDEAVLAEIEAQLQNAELDPATQANLNAQARAARVRIRTAKAQQN